MNSRSLGALIVAALLILIAGFWIGHSRAPQSSEQPALYPDLKGKLASVTGISIFKAGDQLAVEVTREGSAWKVKQRHDYPGDTAKINSFLISLESAMLREQKTANPQNYNALSVQDLSDASTTGVRIEVTGAPSPINLIVGKRDQATRSTYVRRANEAQSWLASADLEIAADPIQWVKRDIVSVSADRIQEATVQLSGSQGYSSSKKTRADVNFDVNGLPKGREIDSNATANLVAQALTSLELDDVRPAQEVTQEKSAGRAVFRTFDGLVLECIGYKLADQRWVVFKSSFDSEQAKRFHVVAQTTPAADPSKSVVPTASPDISLNAELKKGEEDSAAINARVSNWAYALPAFKYDALFKPLDDLLKKPNLMKK